jgi:hypothetical protein
MIRPKHWASIISTCHPFQRSPVSLLRVVLFQWVLLSILINNKKIVLTSHRLAAFHSQCQWTRIFKSVTTSMAMGTQLGLKRHRKSHYSSQCSRKLWFPHYYQWLFLQVALSHPPPTFMGARSLLKRHKGYNYSYHRVQNSYQLFRKSWFDIKVGLLLFVHVTPFQPSLIPLLKVHLNASEISLFISASRKTMNFILMSAFKAIFTKQNMYLRFDERHSSK